MAEDDKTTIINPPPQQSNGSGAGWAVAIVILVIVILFLMYGLPRFRGGTNINVPDKIQIETNTNQ